MSWLICLLTALIFGSVGYIGLFKPKEIQRLMLKYYDNKKSFSALNLLINWFKSNNYILSLKVTGVIGLCGFTFLILCFIMILK